MKSKSRRFNHKRNYVCAGGVVKDLLKPRRPWREFSFECVLPRQLEKLVAKGLLTKSTDEAGKPQYKITPLGRQMLAEHELLAGVGGEK